MSDVNGSNAFKMLPMKGRKVGKKLEKAWDFRLEYT